MFTVKPLHTKDTPETGIPGHCCGSQLYNYNKEMWTPRHFRLSQGRVSTVLNFATLSKSGMKADMFHLIGTGESDKTPGEPCWILCVLDILTASYFCLLLHCCLVKKIECDANY